MNNFLDDIQNNNSKNTINEEIYQNLPYENFHNQDKLEKEQINNNNFKKTNPYNMPRISNKNNLNNFNKEKKKVEGKFFSKIFRRSKNY